MDQLTENDLMKEILNKKISNQSSIEKCRFRK